MKYLIITLIYFFTILLFGESYVGNWSVSTMGAGSKASVSQEKNEISVMRVLEQEFEGEKYLLYHLMKGDINSKKLKLYVKEDKLEKFEYLRDVSFEKISSNSLKIDGKRYIKNDNGGHSGATTVHTKSDGEVEIVFLKKPKKNTHVKEVLPAKETAEAEEVIMLPGGLGERGNKHVNISSGFTTEEKALNSKAIRLMKRKHYKKAISIYLDLYKKDNRNISLLIKIENVYNIIDNKKEAKIYCGKIKKYDPFYPCGG